MMLGNRKKKKDETKNEPPKTESSYFIFGHYGDPGRWSEKWWFVGEYDTKEDAENELKHTGEPEHVTYKVIKGIELRTEPGEPTYPVDIIE